MTGGMRALSIAGCVLAVSALSACSSPDPVYLPALEADPMVSYSHPDLDFEWRLHSPKQRNWKGVDSGADIASLWILKEGADVDAVIEDLLEQGQKAGWAFETLTPAPSESGDTYWRASKYMSEGLAGFTVTLDPLSYRGEVEVWLRLDFVEEDIATPLLGAQQDATYESLSDLRDAIEASGVRCTHFTAETFDGSDYNSAASDGSAYNSATCNEYITIRLFDSHEQTQEHLQLLIDSEASELGAYLAGPNWLLLISGDVGRGTYLQGEMGGELMTAGGGS